MHSKFHLKKVLRECNENKSMRSIIEYIREALGDEVNGFCILKPEFLDHESDFDDMLKNNGWRVVRKEKKTLTPDEAAELYISKKDEEYYKPLCKYMASGDCIAYMCYKDCPDPIKDMDAMKDKIRKAWGKDDMKNAMHSSDSIANVEREYKLIFK